MVERISSAWLWAALLFSTAAAIVSTAALQADPASRTLVCWSGQVRLLRVAAYSIALMLCLKIRADHRSPSTMRTAWLLIALSSAAAIVRHGYEWLAVVLGWVHTNPATLPGLRQIPLVLSLVLLTAGLGAMWSSFAAIGLGPRFRFNDIILLAVILVLVPWIFSQRADLGDSGSAYRLVRLLQSCSPMLLAAPAIVGLVLHRISQEMGSGHLAFSLRYLVAFLVLRLAALVVGSFPAFSGWPPAEVATSAVYTGAPWLFVLGVAWRWRLTLSAGQAVERLEMQPQAEMVRLSRSLNPSGATPPARIR